MALQTLSSRTASLQFLHDHVQLPRVVKISVDFESSKGAFGWTTVKNCYLPFIIRIINGKRVRFLAIKVVDFQLLGTYLNCLHPDIYTDSPVKSYFMTEAEAVLLNDINNIHSDYMYNIGQLRSNTDLIVQLKDVQKFCTFLEVCYGKLQRQVIPQHNNLCGFIRIDSQCVVPYCVKDEQIYVPLFCFEGQIEDLRNRVVKLDNWCWAYLKLCCKVQCVKNELYAMKNSCDGINLESIKEYYHPETNFEVVWPAITEDTLVQFIILQNSSQSNLPFAWFKYPTTLVDEVSVLESSFPVPLVSSSTVSLTNHIGQLHHQMCESAILQQSRNSINDLHYGPPRPLVQESMSLTPVLRNVVIPYSQNTSASSTTLYSNEMLQFYRDQFFSGGTQQQPRQFNLLDSIQLQPTQNSQLMPMTNAIVKNSEQYGSFRKITSTTTMPQLRVTNFTSPLASPLLNGAHEFESIDSLSLQSNSSNQVNITCVNFEWELIKIPEHSWFSQSSRAAYKMMIVEFQGQIIHCINAQPFVYLNTHMLVTLQYLVEKFLPLCSIPKCAYLLNKHLKMKLYSPNLGQLAVLRENYTHIMYTENMPLAMVGDLSEVMYQLKILVAETQGEMHQIKRPRMDFNLGWAEYSRCQLSSPASVVSDMNYLAHNVSYHQRTDDYNDWQNTTASSQSP